MLKPLTPALYIIKTGDTLAQLRAQHGDFEDWIQAGLEGQGLPVRTMDPRSQDGWPAQAQVAAVVVTGSPAMVTDRAQWSERTAAWLALQVRLEVPVLGICYGHQLLAHALGGVVGQHPQGMEIGSVEVQCTPQAASDPLFAALPQRFQAHVVHQQSVLRLPAGATVLAFNAHEPHQAFRAGRHAWGVQFHPEFTQAVMQGYLDLLGRQAADATDPGHAVETPQAAALLARFARWAHAQHTQAPLAR